jgi:hypothetical protein
LYTSSAEKKPYMSFCKARLKSSFKITSFQSAF